MTICFYDEKDLAKFCAKCIADYDRYSACFVFGYMVDIVIKPFCKQVTLDNEFLNCSVEDVEHILKVRKIKYRWVNQF